jgi:hypothetical protein
MPTTAGNVLYGNRVVSLDEFGAVAGLLAR